MNFSPAEWIAQFLVNGGVITRPVDNADWLGTINSSPNKPDNQVTVYDVAGYMDGRYNSTGEVISHPGIQVRVRAKSYRIGWSKADEIRALLDSMLRNDVTIQTVTKRLQNFKRTTDILSLGEERETGQQRQLFTINGMLSFS